MNELTTLIIQRFQQIRPMRQVWDGHWQDIKELVRCDTSDFNRKTVQGYRRYDLVYNGTAIDACEELASGLHAYLSSPTERWFELGLDLQGSRNKIATALAVAEDPEALAWLDMVSDAIYDCYTDPATNFNPSLHEAYLDLASFGTAIMCQEWDADNQQLVFKDFPLAECYFLENNCGHVDSLFRYFEWDGRKIQQEFTPEELKKAPKLLQEIEKGKGQNKLFKLIHHVCPRTDRQYGSALAKEMPFASYYICETTQELIRESGYSDFPYHVSRWIKLGGETYGRGPAMKCLPDIKSLQAMEKTILKAGQKAVDPPLVVPDDGFMLPIKTSPGSLIFKEAGTEKIESLDFKGNVQFGHEEIARKEEYIRKCFYSEWLKRFKKNTEQTATEVQDDRDEMLRFLAPMLGRQQTELLGPMLQRTYNILHAHGKIPPAPQILQKKTLKVIYINPAARAQQGVKADRISRFLQDVIPMAQTDQGVLDNIDMDKMLEVYAKARGVPRSVLRPSQQVAALRQQRQKAQAMQQAAQVAEPASNAVKNIAQAQSLTGGGE